MEYDRRGAEKAEGSDKLEERGAIVRSGCISCGMDSGRDGKRGAATTDDDVLVLPLGRDSAADIHCLME